MFVAEPTRLFQISSTGMQPAKYVSDKSVNRIQRTRVSTKLSSSLTNRVRS